MGKVTLKAARIATGMTQQEMAEKLGVSRTLVSIWERKPETIKPAYFYALLYVTGFKVDDIILQ